MAQGFLVHCRVNAAELYWAACGTSTWPLSMGATSRCFRVSAAITGSSHQIASASGHRLVAPSSSPRSLFDSVRVTSTPKRMNVAVAHSPRGPGVSVRVILVGRHCAKKTSGSCLEQRRLGDSRTEWDAARIVGVRMDFERFGDLRR